MNYMTELEAVNLMLASISEAPINSLDDSASNLDVSMARSTLTDVSREVQSEGWSFNVEEDYPFTPDNAKIVVLPQNIMRVRVDAAAYPSIHPVPRDGKLYDKKNRTFEFSAPFKAEVVLLFDFDELPQEARQYIAIRAARRFAEVRTSDALTSQFKLRDELRARSTMMSVEGRTGRLNVLNSRDVAQVFGGRYGAST